MNMFTNLAEVVQANRQQGYNCAETILRTFNDVLDLQLGQNVRIAAGFGGGIGQTGCVCGALNAAIMVINLLAGRQSGQESIKPIYALTAEFHSLFTQKYGAACCRAIKAKRQGAGCNDLIMQTASLLAEFIQERELA